MVHGFEGHACGHGTVADDGDALSVGLTLVFGGHRHAQGCGDGGGGVSYAEGVIFTFRSFWETTESAIFPVGMKVGASAGEDFMAIGLMSHVPHELVVRGLIDIMQGNRQFHHAKAGSEMSTMYADHINDVLTEFVADLVQPVFIQFAQIFRYIDGFEQWSRLDVHFC